jgi:hypothetical protein
LSDYYELQVINNPELLNQWETRLTDP